MSDLERIEAKHRPEINILGTTTGICVGCDEEERQVSETEPCDVVLLARALASAISNFRALDVDGDARAYEAVLHEVAGGDDDE